ncbi:MAG TPA: hypothetical protein PKE29_09780 [Phycisphaerales bacterium]|nr:hypothetical protein [Phycisphaerales bacterium]
MAQYKFERYLKFSSDAVYDKALPAGTAAPKSGIYRCDGCGHEITVLEPALLPGDDHHSHTAQQKAVRWKLIVADAGTPSAPAQRASF